MSPLTDANDLPLPLTALLRAPRLRQAAYLLAVLVLAAVSYWIFLRAPGVTKNPEKASYAALLHGTADRPYAYRCVLPTVCRALEAALPAGLHERLTEQVARRGGAWLHTRIGIEREDIVLALISFALSYACFVGFALAVRSLTLTLYRAPDGFAELASLVAVGLLPALFRYNSYLYDAATLLLFTWALVMLARGWWSAYLPLFFLAALNKETAVVLILLFALYDFGQRRVSWTRYVLLGAAQVAIYLAVKLLVNHLFAGNGGALVEFHLGRNLTKLQAMDMTTAVAWGALLLLTVHRWGDKPTFLRAGVWMLVPLAGLAGFLGWFDELRGYYEVYPVFLLLMGHSVAGWLGAVPIKRAAPVWVGAAARQSRAGRGAEVGELTWLKRETRT